MKVTDKIENKIARLQEGITFKYKELGILPQEYTAAAKAIERLIKRDIIKRISTGVFYKPKKTAFGELIPGEEELLRPYLFKGKKRVAYITGSALYNKMSLTTQVPKNIKVASRERDIKTRIGSIIVRPVKSYVDVTNDNYYLLEILDALKDFKKIPDMDKKMAINYLLKRINELTIKDKVNLIKIALKYPPRARAFLGALQDKLNSKQPVGSLMQSLNPLTIYDYGISKDILSTVPKWNIK